MKNSMDTRNRDADEIEGHDEIERETRQIDELSKLVKP